MIRKIIKDKFYLPLVLALLVLGAALRAQETISHNFLFLLDQGRDMLAVKSIIYDHHLTLIGPYTGLSGVFQGPLWYYLLSLPTFLTRGDPWGGVVLMFLISMSVLIAVFLWTKKLFGKKVGILTLFLFTISPEAVAAATYTWNPHPLWLLVVLYILSFYELTSKKYKFNLVVWPLIAIMFHFEMALGIPLLVASMIYVIIFARFIIKNKYFIGGVILALLFFVPQILFELRHDFLMSKSVMALFQGSNQGLIVTGEGRAHIDWIRGHLNLFYYNFGTSFIRDGMAKVIPGVALLFMVTVLLVGHKSKVFTKRENDFLLLILRIVLIVIFLSFLYPFPIRYWYLTGFQSFYLLALGLLLAKVLHNNKVSSLIIATFIIILLYYTFGRLYVLYKSEDYGGTAKIKGKIEAIDAIYVDAKGKPFNLLVFTPPVNTDAYDYLLWWYGKGRYGYLPGRDRKDNFYLLIEPDPDKPWSYKGWLETVIKTGRIVNTYELPSGFIIQKRVEEQNEI